MLRKRYCVNFWEVVSPSCRAPESDCRAPGPVPVSLTEFRISFRESYFYVITLKSRQKILFVFTCKLLGDSNSLLQSSSEWLLCPRCCSWWVDRKREEMHSGRVIIYPYVITLKSRCWNICTQADGREKPLKDCLKQTLPRKWRDREKRQIGARNMKWRDEREKKSIQGQRVLKEMV